MKGKKLTIIVISIWLVSTVVFFEWYETLSLEGKEEVRKGNEPFNMTIIEMREKSPRIFNFMIVCSGIIGIYFYLMTRGHPV